MVLLGLSLTALTATITQAQRIDGQYWPCNPAVNKTGSCLPNRGLSSSTYTIDFTKQTTLPEGWTISNYATVKYGANGAEFTFKKPGDAPQLWTKWYMLGCRYEISLQVAPGTGMISSSVLMSDDFDEIDLEFSGNNFGFHPTDGKGQNNYFGKGIAGNYDRGQWFDVAQPMKQFHTYSVDWNSQRTIWGVDGQVLRTFKRSDADAGTHQYPQTPSKLQIGIWDGGGQGMNQGTVDWAGGYTNLSEAPFTMYVKSINIINYTPACAYNWTDQSGTWESVKAITDQNICNSIFGSSASLKTGSTTSTAAKIATPSQVVAASTSSIVAKDQNSAYSTASGGSKAAVVSTVAQPTSSATGPVSKPPFTYSSASFATSSSAVSPSPKAAQTTAATVLFGSPSPSIYRTTSAPHDSLSSSAPRSTTIPTLETTSTVFLSSVMSTSSHPLFLVDGAPPTFAASLVTPRATTTLYSAPKVLASGAPPTSIVSSCTALTSPKVLVSGAPPTFAPFSSATSYSSSQTAKTLPSSAASILNVPTESQSTVTGLAGIPAKGLKATDATTASAPLVASIASKVSSLFYGTTGDPSVTLETSTSTPVSTSVSTHYSTGSSPKFLVSGAPPTFAPSSSASSNGAKFLVSGAPPTALTSSSSSSVTIAVKTNNAAPASGSSSATGGHLAKALFGDTHEPDKNTARTTPAAATQSPVTFPTVASGTGSSSGLTATSLESLLQYIVDLLSAIVNRKTDVANSAAPSASDVSDAYASIQDDVGEVLKKLTSRSERFKKHRKEPHAARRL